MNSVRHAALPTAALHLRVGVRMEKTILFTYDSMAHVHDFGLLQGQKTYKFLANASRNHRKACQARTKTHDVVSDTSVINGPQTPVTIFCQF